ncbi:unnamed protein product [Trichogramma brassicae]|uniref:Uncharacterized protein n=1 Tax=Trichogramma brassicae TaxID=86971 RepID=A0A6H5HV67_9HYME|nr:unnamed protein product [Trichogramma brassicae]
MSRRRVAHVVFDNTNTCDFSRRESSYDDIHATNSQHDAMIFQSTLAISVKTCKIIIKINFNKFTKIIILKNHKCCQWWDASRGYSKYTSVCIEGQRRHVKLTSTPSRRYRRNAKTSYGMNRTEGPPGAQFGGHGATRSTECGFDTFYYSSHKT